MQLTTSPLGLNFVPTLGAAGEPQPPARWAQWWTNPVARFDYGSTSRVPLWAEARLPANRTLTGALRPGVVYAGTTLDDAIAAARLLAATPTEVAFSYRNGRIGRTIVNPAIAVLRDARAGAFWIAPLGTTVRHGSEWLDAPHAIDGAAFEGERPLLGRPVVLAATRDLVAVVGASEVVRPGRWTPAIDGAS